jgi:hypothetical protein
MLVALLRVLHTRTNVDLLYPLHRAPVWLPLNAPHPQAAKVVVPALVRVGEAFVIELEIEEEAITFAMNDEFQIAAAGLHVEPDRQWLRASLTKTKNGHQIAVVRWSAKADVVGQFILVVNARSTEDGIRRYRESVKRFLEDEKMHPNLAFGNLSDTHPDQSPEQIRAVEPITVNVKATVGYFFEKALPFLAAFLGSLLTLPGMFAYKESRDKKLTERLRVQIASEIPGRNPKQI